MSVHLQNAELIAKADLVIIGRIVDASNASLLAKVSEEVQVIYKPSAGERSLWDFPEGSLAGREVAAFYISELGGFNLVPYTLLRDGPYGVGAVQEWIETSNEIDVMAAAAQANPKLRSMALFDAIVNNTDRKFGHILFAESGEIFGCDHGVTFHEEDKLRTVLWQWSGAPLLVTEISQLALIVANIEVDYLSQLITTEEITALLARIDRLKMTRKFPTPSLDWPAVPWPPY